MQFSDRMDKKTLEEGSTFAPKFDDQGLIPCICQDVHSGEVLMFAFMNREALEKTIETGIAHYWSRSRGKLWKKGESSGNTQKIEEIRTDCDQDVILIRVQPAGAACHTGYPTCFFRKVLPPSSADSTVRLDNLGFAKAFNPNDVYRKP